MEPQILTFEKYCVTAKFSTTVTKFVNDENQHGQ